VIDPHALLDVEQAQSHAVEVTHGNAQLFHAGDAAENGPAGGLAVELDPRRIDRWAPEVVNAPVASKKVKVAGRAGRRCSLRSGRTSRVSPLATSGVAVFRQ
jgi:hypothetical protein